MAVLRTANPRFARTQGILPCFAWVPPCAAPCDALRYVTRHLPASRAPSCYLPGFYSLACGKSIFCFAEWVRFASRILASLGPAICFANHRPLVLYPCLRQVYILLRRMAVLRTANPHFVRTGDFINFVDEITVRTKQYLRLSSRL